MELQKNKGSILKNKKGKLGGMKMDEKLEVRGN